jgi:arylsulfatase A-like enzyme
MNMNGKFEGSGMKMTADPGLPAAPGGTPPWKDFLVAAVWLGCLTGLAEGLGLCALQWLHLMSWYMAQQGVTAQIIWISTLVDVIFFTGMGVGFAVLARMFPRLPVAKVNVFALFFLVFVNWLSLPDRIRWYGVLVMALGLATACTRWFLKNEPAVRTFWRRTLPWAVAAGVLAFVGIEGGIRVAERIAIAQLPKAPAEAPNIIVVVLDTVRADHLSAYGYGRETSPNLDRLAKEGVLFENAFSSSNWSPPSHASLVTGLYLNEHGMEWDRPNLEERFLTIAEYLRGRGYRTEASSGNLDWFARTRGFGRGFIRFDDLNFSAGDVIVRTMYGRMLPFRIKLRMNGFHKLASVVNRDAMQWMGRDPSRPFFMMLNYIDSHAAYMAPHPFRTKFLKKPRNWYILADEEADYSRMKQEDLEEEIGAYDGTIAYTDHQLGLLLGELEKLGQAKNTLVIVTADHGDSFGEHGTYLHRNDLYREVVRVPLVIWWPAKVPANRRISRPVSNAAIPATIEDLLGGSAPQAFPGPPLAQLWKTPENAENWPWPLVEVSQQPFPGRWRLPTYSGWMKSLISPRWQYIVHEKRGEELYDWNNDPEERHDQARTPEGREIVREFSEQMKAILARPGEARAMLPAKKPGQ